MSRSSSSSTSNASVSASEVDAKGTIRRARSDTGSSSSISSVTSSRRSTPLRRSRAHPPPPPHQTRSHDAPDPGLVPPLPSHHCPIPLLGGCGLGLSGSNVNLNGSRASVRTCSVPSILRPLVALDFGVSNGPTWPLIGKTEVRRRKRKRDGNDVKERKSKNQSEDEKEDESDDEEVDDEKLAADSWSGGIHMRNERGRAPLYSVGTAQVLRPPDPRLSSLYISERLAWMRSHSVDSIEIGMSLGGSGDESTTDGGTGGSSALADSTGLLALQIDDRQLLRRATTMNAWEKQGKGLSRKQQGRPKERGIKRQQAIKQEQEAKQRMQRQSESKQLLPEKNKRRFEPEQKESPSPSMLDATHSPDSGRSENEPDATPSPTSTGAEQDDDYDDDVIEEQSVPASVTASEAVIAAESNTATATAAPPPLSSSLPAVPSLSTPTPTPAAASHSSVSASSPQSKRSFLQSPSIPNQLQNFRRHFHAQIRPRYGYGPLAQQRGETAATEEATRRCLDPHGVYSLDDGFLTQILKGEEEIERSEWVEDMDAERLAVIHTPTLGMGSYVVAFPSGALMDELSIAQLNLPQPIPTSSSTATLPSLPPSSANVSTQLDSSLQHIMLTSQPPTPTTISHSKPLLPFIVSRTRYCMYVHTLIVASRQQQWSAQPTDASTHSVSSSSSSIQLHQMDKVQFSSPIVHMCPNPWIPFEVALLLQDGTIILWNWQGMKDQELTALQYPSQQQPQPSPAPEAATPARLTRIPLAVWADNRVQRSLNLTLPIPWSRIFFAPTARSLIVVLRQGVAQVDLRAPYTPTRSTPPRGKILPLPPLALQPAEFYTSQYLHEQDMLGVDAGDKVGRPRLGRIYAASRSPHNPFHLVVVGSDYMFLMDMRLGLTDPLVIWRHHQNGEPPMHIEWLNIAPSASYTSDPAGSSQQVPCSKCSEDDVYFVTFTRMRNEVTLYHYTHTLIDMDRRGASSWLLSSRSPFFASKSPSSFFSSYNPLRIPSLIQLQQSQHQQQRGLHVRTIDTSILPTCLVGLKILTLPCQPSNTSATAVAVDDPILYALHLSEYGSIIAQPFQHRHMKTLEELGRGELSAGEIVPIRIRRVKEVDGGAEAEGNAPAQVLTPASSLSSPISSTPVTPCPPSSKPSFLSPTTPAPWMQPSEMKPCRSVDLSIILEKCAAQVTAKPEGTVDNVGMHEDQMGGLGLLPRSADSSPDASSVGRPSFRSLVRSLVHTLNDLEYPLKHFLALPRTLREVTCFLLDNYMMYHLPSVQEIVNTLAPTWNKKRGEQQQQTRDEKQQRLTPPLPSQCMLPYELRSIAAVVMEALHPFTFVDQPPPPMQEDDDEQPRQEHQPHPLYHPQRLSPRISAHTPTRNEGAESKKRTWSSDDSEVDDESSDLPAPTYALYHYHLSLSRFGGTKIESSEPAAKGAVACICAARKRHQSDIDCCCMHPCPSAHCLLLHSTLYLSTPSLPHIPWPTRPDRGVEYEELAGSGGIGHRGAPISYLRPPPSRTGGIVEDLSQDIAFLMASSGTGTQQSMDINTQEVAAAAPGYDYGDDNEDSANANRKVEAKMNAMMSTDEADANHAAAAEAGESPKLEPPPSDPLALQDMLALIGASWQRYERIMEQAVALRHGQVPSLRAIVPSSAASTASGASTSGTFDLAAAESAHADEDMHALREWLSHRELSTEMATTQVDAAATEIGEDMRDGMAEMMEEHAAADDDED